MAKINLLPWREERRKQRQQEFYVLLGVSAAAAVVVVLAALWFMGTQIDQQNARLTRLKAEITQLDAQIKEIEELDRKKERLIARKEIIEELQATRSQMVHLFDELVKTLPEGIQLKSIKQGGQTLTLDGLAQSNARVAAYARSLDASPWLKESEIGIIEAKGNDKALPYVFTMRVNLQNPEAKSEEEAGGEAVAQAAGGAK